MILLPTLWLSTILYKFLIIDRAVGHSGRIKGAVGAVAPGPRRRGRSGPAEFLSCRFAKSKTEGSRHSKVRKLHLLDYIDLNLKKV